MKNNLNLAEESMAFVQKYGCPPVEIIEKAMMRALNLRWLKQPRWLVNFGKNWPIRGRRISEDKHHESSVHPGSKSGAANPGRVA